MNTTARVGYSYHRNPTVAGREAVLEAQAGGGLEQPSVAFVFATAGYDVDVLLAAIRDTTGEAPLVGCSGRGVIAGQIFDESSHAVGVMLIRSEHLQFTTGVATGLREDPTAVGRHVGDQLGPAMAKDSLGLLLFADSRTMNFKRFCDGLDEVLDRPEFFPIWGAGAGDDFQFEHIYQYCDDTVVSDGVTWALVRGRGQVICAVDHGCVPIGGERVVTSSHGNQIHEIDGTPALDVLGEYADTDSDESWNQLRVAFALGFQAPESRRENDDRYVRAVVGGRDLERGTIGVCDEVEPGTSMWMMRRDYERIRTSIHTVVDTINRRSGGRRPSLILQIECAGRGSMMLRTHEQRAVMDILQTGLGQDVPWLGLFSFAEIAPIGRFNCLHNYTSVIVAFYDQGVLAPTASSERRRQPAGVSGTDRPRHEVSTDREDNASLRRANHRLSEQVKRMVEAETQLYSTQERLESQGRLYKQLYNTGQALLDASMKRAQVLEVALAYLTYGLGFQRALILGRAHDAGPEQTALTVQAHDGYFDEEIVQSVTGQVLTHDDPVLVALRAQTATREPYLLWTPDTDKPRLAALADRLGMGAGCIVAAVQGEAGGVIVVGNSAAKGFYSAVQPDSDELVGLVNLATQLASVLENARLYRRQLAINAQLRAAMEELARREAERLIRYRQLETVAYVTTHDLRGAADQVQYDGEELQAILPVMPPALIEEYDLRELAINVAQAAREQLALLDGVDQLVGLWQMGQPELEWFDGSAFIRAHLAAMSDLPDGQITVEDIGEVHANREMFGTIIGHLVDNGLKYNHRPNREVAIERLGTSLLIRDNGDGIPAGKLDQATQIFQRFDARVSGKGLGLTISEALIQCHGWTMSLDSVAGEGSTITIDMQA